MPETSWPNGSVKERPFAILLENTSFIRLAFDPKWSKEKMTRSQNFEDYFDFDQPLKKCPGHRFLAMKRAEDEGVIRLSITPPRVEGIERVGAIFY